MKNLLFSLAFILITTVTFAQQEIEIINNTGQPLDILIESYGTDPLTLLCNSCSNAIFSDIFTIGLGSVIFDNFTDFDALTPPVAWHDGPGGLCNSPNPWAPCDGVQSDAFCGDPIWQMVAFSHPGGGPMMGRVGQGACGFNNSYSDPSITASWNIISPTEILVILN